MSQSNGNTTPLRPVPPALPATREDYLALRKIKTPRTINDMVEEVHLSLAGNSEYEDLLFAIYPEQAVEKSLLIDDTMAAQLIRNKARQLENNELANESLAAIVKALHVVMRRYQQSRKERRNMVGGVKVENDEDATWSEHEHIDG